APIYEVLQGRFELPFQLGCVARFAAQIGASGAWFEHLAARSGSELGGVDRTPRRWSRVPHGALLPASNGDECANQSHDARETQGAEERGERAISWEGRGKG